MHHSIKVKKIILYFLCRYVTVKGLLFQYSDRKTRQPTFANTVTKTKRLLLSEDVGHIPVY